MLTSAQVADRMYSNLGEILFEACMPSGDPRVSAEMAHAALRLEAARLSADSVLDVSCAEGGLSLEWNCWKTLRCTGTAIGWEDPPENLLAAQQPGG
jgi:hypothetical protein